MNWSNYDDVIDQMRAFGLLVDGLEVGRLRRCRIDGDRERRGWYSLHELLLDDGDVVLVGSFGIWRGAENNAQKVELRKRKLTSDQAAAMKARIADDKKKADIARKAESKRAADAASRAWGRYDATGGSEYLARKGVQGHGVRYTSAGSVVVPLMDVGRRIYGLQLIYPKGHPKAKRTGRDKDFWPAGLAKLGHFFMLGMPLDGSVILVAEGYATGATLFEATGLPVAVAFDAGNLQPVAANLKKAYPRARILICADDDYLTAGNPGVSKASAAALAVGGGWIAPVFSQDREGKKITDFNDLYLREGLHVVTQQVSARLSALGWDKAAPPPRAQQGGGDSGDLTAIDSVDELHERFALVYEMADTVFDAQEHKLVPLSSQRNACTSRMLHRQWMESREKKIVRVREVGFDPGGRDPGIKCNLWGGWPTVPKDGACEKLLQLLGYLCSGEESCAELYDWVIRWLAYPIQHPGAKMKTALVLHGPQGTGKNLFFEAVMSIYGEYGRIVDQSAVEDKFNDWASRKLFLIADEVVARMELYHTKNKLKSLITGEWIRINPKNIGAYDERNHVNLVFLSNETMPLALERDDRRYTVIWTPEKLDKDFYHAVAAEIRDGGIPALHDYLLNLDLRGFRPETEPPMTRAKADLIDLGMDSTEKFWVEWVGGLLPLPVVICRSENLYDAYRHYCARNGIAKPAQANTFLGNCSKRPGAGKARKRFYRDTFTAEVEQSMVVYPPGSDMAAAIRDITEQVQQFVQAMDEWKTGRSPLREAA